MVIKILDGRCSFRYKQHQEEHGAHAGHGDHDHHAHKVTLIHRKEDMVKISE